MLVKRLLTPDLTKRYGNLKNGVTDIKEHKWFRGFDWNGLLKKQLEPPYKPTVKVSAAHGIVQRFISENFEGFLFLHICCCAGD